MCGFCFFKQKTAYELRISDWSSDVCSSDLRMAKPASFGAGFVLGVHENCPGRVGESSRLKPLLQDQKQELAASAAPAGFAGGEALAVAFDLDLRGPP